MSEFWLTVGLAALSWGVAIYMHFRAFVRGAREDAKARHDEIAAEARRKTYDCESCGYTHSAGVSCSSIVNR